MLKGFDADYLGYDVIPDVISVARQAHKDNPRCSFYGMADELPMVDYTVASGIFNYCGKKAKDEWTDYVCQTLCHFNRLSKYGFASNFLTKYSDLDRVRADLY